MSLDPAALAAALAAHGPLVRVVEIAVAISALSPPPMQMIMVLLSAARMPVVM